MTKEHLKEQNISKEKLSDKRFLILHNDDKNTFDFVIENLIEVCNHDEIQAEQCAFITHFKGKCDVKKGDVSSLKSMKDKLISKGLSVTID